MEPPAGLTRRADDTLACAWSGSDPDYVSYHDEEWGRPVVDDTRLFEKICLEGFQSGLSWLTILRKRTAFRRAFLGFDMEQVSGLGPADVERLLTDASIIRHRQKIEATINNAGRALDAIAEFGSLARYLWRFEPSDDERPAVVDHAALATLTTSPASHLLARDLKSRGWRFVGPTTAYAFMQAMGMVNDHLEGCFCRAQIERARSSLHRP